MQIASHTTALRLARRLRASRKSFTAIRVDPDNVSANHLDEARRLVQFVDPTFPSTETLHMLVFNQADRHRSPGAIIHHSSRAIDSEVFYRVTPYLAIIGPELLFLQMASTLDRVRLFLLGLELCGTYAIDATLQTGFADELEPFTTPLRISNFLEHATGAPAVAKARDVAKMLASGSASPQESRVYVKLTAPRTMGGYGIDGLVLNFETPLSKGAQLIADKKFCRIDLALPKCKIAIEYESKLVHDDESQGQRDKRRRDALVHDGWDVTSIVPSTMNDRAAFGVLARRILKTAGCNVRVRSKSFEEANKALFQALRVPD